MPDLVAVWPEVRRWSDRGIPAYVRRRRLASREREMEDQRRRSRRLMVRPWHYVAGALVVASVIGRIAGAIWGDDGVPDGTGSIHLASCDAERGHMVARFELSGPTVFVDGYRVDFVDEVSGEVIETQPVEDPAADHPEDEAPRTVVVTSDHEASGEFSCDLG